MPQLQPGQRPGHSYAYFQTPQRELCHDSIFLVDYAGAYLRQF